MANNVNIGMPSLYSQIVILLLIIIKSLLVLLLIISIINFDLYYYALYGSHAILFFLHFFGIFFFHVKRFRLSIMNFVTSFPMLQKTSLSSAPVKSIQ